MNIFFGAAFDPPHKEHIEIIKKLLKNPEDKIFIGITDHNYKEFKFNYDQRFEMLKLAFKCQGINTSNLELIIKQKERTWRFLTYDLTNIDTIVIGQDEWESLLRNEWKFSRLLLEKYIFIVIPRKDDVSSTKIREWIKVRKPYDDEIAKYIDEPVYEVALNY